MSACPNCGEPEHRGMCREVARSPRYTLEPGRGIARDGVTLAFLQRREIPEAEHPDGASGAHAITGPDADNLAREIVAALNAEAHAEGPRRVAMAKAALRMFEDELSPADWFACVQGRASPDNFQDSNETMAEAYQEAFSEPPDTERPKVRERWNAAARVASAMLASWGAISDEDALALAAEDDAHGLALVAGNLSRTAAVFREFAGPTRADLAGQAGEERPVFSVEIEVGPLEATGQTVATMLRQVADDLDADPAFLAGPVMDALGQRHGVCGFATVHALKHEKPPK